MSRINVSGGGGGLTEALADTLYVKILGDTMIGPLVLNNGSVITPNNSPLLTFQTRTPAGPYLYQAAWYATGDEGAGYGAMALEFTGPYGIGNETMALINSSDGTMAWGPLGQDGYTGLGRSSFRFKDLWLMNGMHLGDDIVLSTDETVDFGDSTNGVRQIVFSDAQTGSNRAAFRGCKMVASNADIYWGVDDVFPGFYVQKSVVSGSTATDNSQDYTNLYQGDSSYSFLAINFDIARTVDGTSNPTNGIRLGDGSFATAGSSLQFFGGGARFFEMYFDQTNNVMRMECGKTNGTRTPTLEFRLAGTGPAIRPYLDNSIDIGTSSLMWKDGYFKGDVRQRQAICTGDNAGVASTVSFTNTNDLTTNSTGVGTILFKGTTNRNSTGFIKIYVGTTAYYVPVFAAITG